MNESGSAVDTSLLSDIFPADCLDRVVMAGGTARDLILGRAFKDVDLIAALGAEELTALGFRLVEASSGADIYFRHIPDRGKIEITRIDTMADLSDDLLRRDFTINAIAVMYGGNCIDPLNGRDDLAAGVLRPCSADTFITDPLRMFRAFRFACDGWRMTPETEALIRRQAGSAVFTETPVERFSGEMLKALASGTPERFFQLMVEFNAGADFLPELFRMPDIPAGPLEHHPEGDLCTHSVQVLQRVSAVTDDPLARFCAFFHDIGKLATETHLYPKHHGHETAGFERSITLCNRLRLPASYRTALAWISRLHGTAHLWTELRDSTRLKIASQAVRAGITEILPLVAGADKPVRVRMDGWDYAVAVSGMNSRELGIDGELLDNMATENRQAFIQHKRLEMLRRNYGCGTRSD